MDSSPERNTKQKSKKPKIDAPDAQLTPAERVIILEKATRTAIRNRRALGTKNQEYFPSPSIHRGKHKKLDSGKASSAFLITALEELRRFEEGEQNHQIIIDLERELEHLHNGIVNRDSIIKKLRAELEEKNRILESIPRELVVNWVASQRMMSREQLDVNILKTL